MYTNHILKYVRNLLACVQQLQLLQKVQEAERVIAMAMNFVGDQKELEATLADAQVGRYTEQDTGAELELPSYYNC